MNKNKTRIHWKHQLLLLVGIGISNIGDWIYLIALNLIIKVMNEKKIAKSGIRGTISITKVMMKLDA